MSLLLFPLRRSSVSEIQIRVWTEFGPLFPLSFPCGKGGGGGGGGRGFFSVQDYVIHTLYEFSRIYLFTCSVYPYLNQLFRRCFSMDNLRAYVEDGSESPSVQEQLAKRPNPSAGLSTSSSTPSSSLTAPSTRASSGPVPEVSTPSPSTVPQDKTVSLEDLPPPPPPAEPYEHFLARVAHQMASLPGGPPRPAAAGPPQPPEPIPTAGSRLPMPFPRFEDTSWATHPQVQVPRIRMPLPSSCYVPPPSPWTWPGRGLAVSTPQVRGLAPLTSSTGPIRLPGPATLSGGPPASGPLPPLLPPSSSSEPKNTSPTPRAFADFFRVPRPLWSQWRLRPARPLRLPRRHRRLLGTSLKGPHRRWSRTGRLNSLRTCDCTGNSCRETLHPSQPWVPLFPRGTWAPTHCGSWVPLATERRHGLSISPAQNEEAATLATTAAHARDLLVTALDHETVVPKRLRTPPPGVTGQPLPNAPAETARGPMAVAHRKAGSVPNALADLGPLVAQVIGDVIPLPLRHLHAGTGVARLPLVGPLGPAWLRGLLGAPHRRPHGDLPLIVVSLVIHHGTVLLLIRLVLVDVIIIISPHPLLGRLHLKGPGPRAFLILAAPPGLSAGSVVNIHTTRTSVSCVCGRTPTMNVTLPVPIPVVLPNQNNLQWMMMLSLRRRSRNFLPT